MKVLIYVMLMSFSFCQSIKIEKAFSIKNNKIGSQPISVLDNLEFEIGDNNYFYVANTRTNTIDIYDDKLTLIKEIKILDEFKKKFKGRCSFRIELLNNDNLYCLIFSEKLFVNLLKIDLKSFNLIEINSEELNMLLPYRIRNFLINNDENLYFKVFPRALDPRFPPQVMVFDKRGKYINSTDHFIKMKGNLIAKIENSDENTIISYSSTGRVIKNNEYGKTVKLPFKKYHIVPYGWKYADHNDEKIVLTTGYEVCVVTDEKVEYIELPEFFKIRKGGINLINRKIKIDNNNNLHYIKLTTQGNNMQKKTTDGSDLSYKIYKLD